MPAMGRNSRLGDVRVPALASVWRGRVARLFRTRPPRPEPLLAFRLLDRPLREHAGQVLLVLRGSAQVAGRVEPVGGVLRRVLRLGAVMQSLLDRGRAHRRRSYVGPADAPSAVHLLGSHADDRSVEKPAVGWARRSRINGMRLWPPASTLASSPNLSSSLEASSTEEALA